MLNSKDDYERMEVSRTATADDVKKAYRKLATIVSGGSTFLLLLGKRKPVIYSSFFFSLQLHPDKNKAPGSEEAFKRLASFNLFLLLYSFAKISNSLFITKNYSLQQETPYSRLQDNFFFPPLATLIFKNDNSNKKFNSTSVLHSFVCCSVSATVSSGSGGIFADFAAEAAGLVEATLGSNAAIGVGVGAAAAVGRTIAAPTDAGAAACC